MRGGAAAPGVSGGPIAASREGTACGHSCPVERREQGRIRNEAGGKRRAERDTYATKFRRNDSNACALVTTKFANCAECKGTHPIF